MKILLPCGGRRELGGSPYFGRRNSNKQRPYLVPEPTEIYLNYCFSEGLVGQMIKNLRAVILISFFPVALSAADLIWQSPTGGAFGDDANWDGSAVPGLFDRAIFNDPGLSYVIDFSNDWTTRQLLFRNGAVAFNLAGTTQTVSRVGSPDGPSSDIGFIVGDQGGDDASLTLNAAGTLAVQGVRLGNVSGATGLLNLDHSGARFTAAAGTIIGYEGNGSLNLSGGAQATSSGTGPFVAHQAGSQGSVTIDGADSLWTVTQGMRLGNFGDATLSITNGGLLSSTFTDVARETGSSGAVTVSGADARWNASSYTNFGYQGDATLLISDGGHVSNTQGQLAVLSDSSASVTVTGDGSRWDNSAALRIGMQGDASLTISDGGVVTAGSNTAIAVSGSGTATVLVTGAGSTLSSNGSFLIGQSGNAQFTIADGGTVNTGPFNNFAVSIGSQTSSNSELFITGAGSSFTTEDQIRVGANSRLRIEDGGALTARRAAFSGSVSVSGEDSLLSVAEESSHVMHLASTTQLLLSEGGRLISGETQSSGPVSGLLPTDPMITVTGAGSKWQALGNLFLGLNHKVGAVVSDGGKVSSPNTVLGYFAGAHGQLIVTETDSLWETESTFFAGFTGSGSVSVSGGGHLNTGTTVIALNPGSEGEIFVTGAGSRLSAVEAIHVGGNRPDAGGAGLLNVSDGAEVSAALLWVSSTGTLTGGGGVIVADVENAGTVAPGNSPGTLHVTGNYTQTATGILEIEIAGTEAGLQYDQLLVSGNVFLNGALALTILDDFSFGLNQRFGIIQGQSISGIFDGLAHGSLVGTFNGIDLFIEYNPLGEVALVSIPEPSTYAAILAFFTAGLILIRRRRCKKG